MQGWWMASYLVLWLLVILLCVLVVALARQIGTLHLRLGPRGALEMDDEGPPLGEAPPPADATDLAGTSVTIGGPGRAQLLLFVSPGCRACDQVLASVAAVARSGAMAPLVVTDVDAHETARAFGKRAGVVPGAEIAARFAVPGTPFAVVLDDRGVVRAKGTVNDLEQMEGLVDTARRRVEGAAGAKRAS